MVIINEEDHIAYDHPMEAPINYHAKALISRITRTLKGSQSIFQANNGPRTFRSTYVPSGFERNSHF